MQNSAQHGALENSNNTATPETQANAKLEANGDVLSDPPQGPPPKRRKLADSSSRSTPRPPSPPWKRAGVDGPTSFLDGGRRRSTRTNALPPEPSTQSSHRHPRSAQKDFGSRTKQNGTRIHEASPLSTTAHSAIMKSRRAPSTRSSVNGNDTANRKDSARALGVKTTQAKQPSSRNHLRKHSDTEVRAINGNNLEHINGHGANDSVRNDNMAGSLDSGHRLQSIEDDTGQNLVRKAPRIRFKVKIPSLTPQHPSHILPLKRHSSFRDWVEKEANADDEFQVLTPKAALKEYHLWGKLWKQAEPGGLLSEEKCSIYLEEPEEEPPQQYSHTDHFIAHALYFKKLLDKERRNHRHLAKQLAQWCADAWKKRHKRPEDILKEQEEDMRQKRRTLIKDLQRQFSLARAEVERVKLVQLEEKQKAEEQLALNKALKQSTMLWEKRVGDREDNSGTDHSGEDSGYSDESEDEDNMSSSDSESDSVGSVDDDATLSPQALRAKYAHLASTQSQFEDDSVLADESLLSFQSAPSETSEGQVESTQFTDLDTEFDGKLDEVDPVLLDDSDESTDMEESEESVESDEDGSSEGYSESEPGLLGFFSAKDIPNPGDDDPNGEHSLNAEDDKYREDGDDEENGSDGEDEADAVHFVPTEPHEVTETTDSAIGPDVLDPTHPPTPSITNPVIDKLSAEKPIDESLTQEPPSVMQGICRASPIGDKETSTKLEDAVSTIRPPSPASLASPRPGGISPINGHEAEAKESVDKADSVQEEYENHPQPLNDTDSISAKTSSIKTPVPHLLRGTLREYQHFGLDWLAGLYASNINGILADEMGLGKTIQTIALLAHLAVEHEVWGPHLVVVPTSVMLNWEMEFKKWCPGFKILTYYGTQEERRQKRKGWMDDNRWHVCITSYQLVLQDQQTFKRRNWHYMVLDEAHNIKNFRSQRWQTLLTFKTRARLLLTGTPLQNNLTELWSLLFFLMPNDDSESGVEGFADLRNFSEWFRRPVEQILEHGRETMDDDAKKVVSKLHTVLRPYILRRLKIDVEKQMPLKYEHVVTCRLSKRQRFLYDGFMSRTKTKETLASGHYLSIINCLMQLRKVCNHPDLFETRPITTSFAMPSSAIADFEIKNFLVRRRLLSNSLSEIDLDFLNLVPISRENTSRRLADDAARIMAYNPLRLLRERQYNRTSWKMEFNGSSIQSVLDSMENAARKSRMAELERCLYFESKRHGRRPLFGDSLIEFLTLDKTFKPSFQRRPPRRMLIDWLSRQSLALEAMVLSLEERARMVEPLLQKFACITPIAVSPAVTKAALTPIKSHHFSNSLRVPSYDPYHEAQMRLSIAFPDKRLLQYDCGKLQQLDRLLRQLQTGGHRALIFTQMTKMLDILEQFLNVHGHRYLRLDGATKIEQRQLLTERFNSDPRILVFILSSRSGGLGINLTGADTVIFYDLDWNPAMDKQCQDRCHRIGQTRDVHIYRFVSEYTIESNILRKANQKRMLDDVIIQEGEFTTEHFQKFDVRDMLTENIEDGQDEASAAMDMVLDNKVSNAPKMFDEAEDKEDLDAAKNAAKELEHVDDADFAEGSVPQTPGHPGTSQAETPRTGGVAEDGLPSAPQTEAPGTPAASASVFASVVEENIGHIDDYLIRFMEWNLKDEPLALLPDKNKRKSRKGREHRIRRHR